MVTSVLNLLKPLTAKRLDGIEELAARLAAGTVVPAEEVAAILEKSRCNPADLQRAVDRHARVAELGGEGLGLLAAVGPHADVKQQKGRNRFAGPDMLDRRRPSLGVDVSAEHPHVHLPHGG